jgi:hypothetical protein
MGFVPHSIKSHEPSVEEIQLAGACHFIYLFVRDSSSTQGSNLLFLWVARVPPRSGCGIFLRARAIATYLEKR